MAAQSKVKTTSDGTCSLNSFRLLFGPTRAILQGSRLQRNHHDTVGLVRGHGCFDEAVSISYSLLGVKRYCRRVDVAGRGIPLYGRACDSS